MSSEILFSEGPEPDITTFTTPQALCIEVRENSERSDRWAQEYIAVRDEFRANSIDQARQFLADNKPAEAIIASRLALDIPQRTDAFRRGQLPKRDINTQHGELLSREARIERVRELNRSFLSALAIAAGSQYEIKEELTHIVEVSRAAIETSGVDAWTTAIDYFDSHNQLHAAGIGRIELAEIYEHDGEFSQAIALLHTAGQQFKQRGGELRAQANVTNYTAEMDELRSRLIDVSSKIIQLNLANGSVNSHDKEFLKTAVYDLDDYTGSTPLCKAGYLLLAQYSRFRERHFYNREARGIDDDLAIDAQLAREGLVFPAMPRRAHQNSRPSVRLN